MCESFRVRLVDNLELSPTLKSLLILRSWFILNVKTKLIFLQHVNKFVYICAMKTYIEKFKGIHPGIILKRELKKRELPMARICLVTDSADLQSVPTK